jgi:hypothetical protein
MRPVSDALHIVIFAFLYMILDHFESTRHGAHVEFAARIGGTSLMMYLSNQLNGDVLHWLFLISSGYFLWHSFRTLMIEKDIIYSYHYIFSFLVCIIGIKGYLPLGIMLLLCLMEVPSIFYNTCVVINKKYKMWQNTIVCPSCHVLFYITWIYFRLWIILPVLFSFSFFDTNWSLKTPTGYVYIMRICVFILICLHLYWFIQMCRNGKKILLPTTKERLSSLYKKLSL